MNEIRNNLFVVLHNVTGVSKIIDTSQVVYGLGYQNFVVSRAEGSAAQTGIPEANRLALKMKRNFIVLPDLGDVIELLGVKRPLLMPSPLLTKERISVSELARSLRSGERVALVLSGSNSSFSRREMDMGDCRSLDADVDIGPSGTAAVVLYGLSRELSTGPQSG